MTRPALRVPHSLDEVTPAWVTEAVRSTLPGVEVTSLSVSDVSFGSACRARLHLQGTGEGLPATLMLKGSFTEGLGDDEVAQQWLQLMGTLNAAEQLFYAHHSTAMGDRVPGCFHVDADPDGTTILLLEDLASRKDPTFGAFDVPRTKDQMAQVLDALARLHASRWEDPVLDDAPLPDGMMDGGMVPALLSDVNWEQQASRPRWGRVPAELDDHTLVRDAILRLWDIKRERGGCLIHGDPHIANTYFDADGAGLLDFQLFTSGHWASDVVYATASALTIEDRRTHERELLAGYLDALARYGVTPPSWEDAWLAYRRFSLWGFVVLLTPGEGVQSEDYNTVVGERHAVAAVDLGAIEAIG